MNNTSINQIYRHWRIHLMLTMYLGYASFYLTRKSFHFALPAMMEELSISKDEIGLIATLFYLTYGMSKFISGMVSDKVSPRYFMAVGLLLTGITNIAFGFSSSLVVLATLWVINAWFQGWGWPASAKLLTTWYSRNERGLWWSIWNTAQNVGGAVIPLIISYFVLHYSWRHGFWAAGIITMIMSLLLFWRLRNTPEKMGLPSVGEWRQDALEIIQEQEGKEKSWKAIVKEYVFFNKYLWLLAVSYLLVYIVRTAINDWGNLYLTESAEYDLVTANTALALFEIGGLLGSLAAGWGSDKFFASNRGQMALLFAIGIFVSITALWLLPKAQILYQSLLFFIIGFFVFGPQMLIGMAAAECSHKQMAGTATGFIGLFAYLGAAFAGYPLALIMQSFNWTGFFVVISSCSVGISLLLLPFLQTQR